MRYFAVISVLVVVTTLLVACDLREPSISCAKQGTYGVFVAIFDGETVGSLPASSTLYGPPGASLNVQAAPNTIEVVNSAALGSRALWVTRPPFLPANTVEAVLGEIDDTPNDSGVYYINFEAHGEVIPQHFIAGMGITVLSADGLRALSLKLFDGSYHVLTGGAAGALPATSPLSGTYDPSAAHSVHIELNLDTQKFSICINDEVVVSNRAFLDDNVANLHSLKFFGPATITEAFDMAFVVDEIRITK